MNFLDDGPGSRLNDPLNGWNGYDLIVNLWFDDGLVAGADVVDGLRTWNASGGTKRHPLDGWSSHVFVDDGNGRGCRTRVAQSHRIRSWAEWFCENLKGKSIAS